MIYKVSAILIKFFMEFQIMHTRGKDPRIANIVQEKKGKELALPDIKTVHRVVIKI